MINSVYLTKRAQRDLTHCPGYIGSKFKYWVGLVETFGLEAARQIKGFHDEPLKGTRQGQRSIRLSRSYRAIYVVLNNDSVGIVEVQEVSKHDY